VTHQSLHIKKLQIENYYGLYQNPEIEFNKNTKSQSLTGETEIISSIHH